MKPQLVWIVVLAAAVGCGTGNSPNTASSDQSDQVAEDLPPASVAPRDGADAAAIDPSQFTIGTPPETICQAFVDLLRRGESGEAEKLLSQESMTQTRRHHLELALPAGPAARYEVGAALYATNQAKLAFVPVSLASEDSSSGGPPMSMMLRYGKYGWKITGMLLTLEEQSQDLISFENPLDVVRIKSLIEGDVRQARVPGADESEYR
jgi:hypothetical protein